MKLKKLQASIALAVAGLANTGAAFAVEPARDAQPGDLPYVVAIAYNGKVTCTGTIIAPRAILTSAGCLGSARPGELTVRSGSVSPTAGGQVSLVDQIFPYPLYSPPYGGDIAVLKLKTPLSYSQETGAIPLASSIPTMNLRATIAGWGGSLDQKSRLQTGLDTTLLPLVCRLTYLNKPDTTFCTEAPLAPTTPALCQGDFGGPLVINGVLNGVAVHKPAIAGCTDTPDLFTAVSAYTDWIRSVIIGF